MTQAAQASESERAIESVLEAVMSLLLLSHVPAPLHALILRVRVWWRDLVPSSLFIFELFRYL